MRRKAVEIISLLSVLPRPQVFKIPTVVFFFSFVNLFVHYSEGIYLEA